jgi:hypothetical protein
MSDLYEDDIVLWSERQAELLRRRAAGKLVNDAEFDWPNIAEEVEAVGQSQIDALESLITNILSHMLKCEAWPHARYVPHWQAEIRGWRRQLRRKMRTGWRQRFNIDELYGDALAMLPPDVDGAPARPVWQTCPVTLDELLSDP